VLRGAAIVLAVAAAGLGLTALPANAAVPPDLPQVLSSWTQPNDDSFNQWSAAHANQGNWAAYEFDWSTDLCSNSPDRPLGFDFRIPCTRHDFGYRNYKKIDAFDSGTRKRIDDSFLVDMRRVCNGNGLCNSVAWSYYQAVRAFGGLNVTKADIDRIAEESQSGNAA
jgi:hypothetical protein